LEKSIFEECYKHYISGWKLGETWGSLAEKFSYSSAEALRNSFKRERDRRGIPGKNADTNLDYNKDNYKISEEIKADGSITSDRLIEISEMDKNNPEALLRAHRFNPSAFELVSAKNNLWHAQEKGGKKQLLYQSKITVKPALPKWTEESINNLFDNLKIKDLNPIKSQPKSFKNNGKSLIFPLADLHYCLLATDKSTGNEYNQKIAEYLVWQTIDELKNKVSNQSFEEVVFIAGNDFLNFDNILGTTTKGVYQDNTSLWYDAIDDASELIIKIILSLSEISKVKVISIQGNHDSQSFYSIMKAVSYYFKDDKNIDIDCSPLPRKYYRFGKNIFGLSHNLPVKKALEIMSTEIKDQWSECNHFYWLLGHLHTGMIYEKQGFVEIYRLPTISGWSRWSTESGYVQTEKKTQCFIVDKEKGIENVLNIIVE